MEIFLTLHVLCCSVLLYTVFSNYSSFPLYFQFVFFISILVLVLVAAAILVFVFREKVSNNGIARTLKKVEHIKGRLLDQAVILFNYLPFQNGDCS